MASEKPPRTREFSTAFEPAPPRCIGASHDGTNVAIHFSMAPPRRPADSRTENEAGARFGQRLIALLRAAYSAEMAAAYAYEGHARSVAHACEREAIQQIERDEWVHRARVGELLHRLGAAPSPARELIFRTIGRILRFLCPYSGWHLPMLIAWRLEKMNIGEYARAAAAARDFGDAEIAASLAHMSQIEADHERYFRETLLARIRPATNERARREADATIPAPLPQNLPVTGAA
jgi:demethoxyubiquinone hydroxylase (CLK1/Coq7/Cat5 family)